MPLPSEPVIYRQRHVVADARAVAVLVPPFAEEKKAAQRALVEVAWGLAAAGCETWRFDFRGTGDSSGDHGEVDLDDWLADLRAVVAEAREAVPDRPLILLGLRLGASLAWLAAADPSLAADSLVLWEPLPSGSGYMRQNRQKSQLRRELTAGEGPAAIAGGGDFPAFDFDGFLVSGGLHRGLAGVDLLSGPLPHCRRALMLQISGTARLKKPLEDLRDRLASAGVEVLLENVAVEAFWSSIGLVDTEPVRERTITWLANAPGPLSLQGETLSEPASPVEVQSGVLAEALAFQSGDQRCQGVLYRPASGEVERAVVLLHGWSGYRIGPGRLLTRAARALAGAGCAACSFDFRGRGESEWSVAEASLNSMIRDAARAVPLVCERTGAGRVTLLGLCSGSEVAIGAGLSDPRIDGLVLWSAPIFSGNFDFARRARRGRAMLARYARKLLCAETWAKLFSGRLNWRLIARAVTGGRSSEDAAVADKAPETGAQMAEFAAFGGRLLFIHGGHDPETAPSREFYQRFVESAGLPHRFHLIDGANHNFFSRAWQDEVIGVTIDWLGEDSTSSGGAR